MWEGLFNSYGEHYLLIVLAVALSLVGVVLWGVMAGSLLPFILRLGGLDPASASAPFVATDLDVSALVIYFSIAGVVLRGSLLYRMIRKATYIPDARPSSAALAAVADDHICQCLLRSTID